MHEMSIAVNIVELAENAARKENAEKISSIELEIGQLSGVVIDALKFALDSAVKNTMLENSRVVIISTPGLCRCLKCQHEFESEEAFTVCNRCGSNEVKIIRGQEMRVKSLLVE